MELKAKPRSRAAARLHFAVRFFLLSALLVAGVGAVLAYTDGINSVAQIRQALRDVAQGEAHGEPPLSFYLVLGALGVTLVCLLIECVIGLRMVAGRRSAVGGN